MIFLFCDVSSLCYDLVNLIRFNSLRQIICETVVCVRLLFAPNRAHLIERYFALEIHAFNSRAMAILVCFVDLTQFFLPDLISNTIASPYIRQDPKRAGPAAQNELSRPYAMFASREPIPIQHRSIFGRKIALFGCPWNDTEQPFSSARPCSEILRIH